MPSFDAADLLLTTAKVVGETAGTGFFVIRGVEERKSKMLLVTNKHVLHKNRVFRTAMDRVTVFLNHEVEGKLIRFEWPIPLRVGNHNLMREHPDDDVDVLAIDFSWAWNALAERGATTTALAKASVPADQQE